MTAGTRGRNRLPDTIVARQRHLSRAPITEAIVDIRVKARTDMDALDFTGLRESLAPEFPRATERRGFSFGMTSATGEAELKDLGLQGFFFHSADEKTIAQFRIDGFTLNRLAPYTSWEALRPIVARLWQVYLETARPDHVVRVALRYLNRVPIPESPVDLDKYLAAAPSIPAELPQLVSRFLTKVTLQDPDARLTAHVTQQMESDLASRQLVVLLDIDAFQERDQEQLDVPVEPVLEHLHDFKNRIFFGLLTEDAVRMFE